jgi:predicted cupin superfamily sugar epimerase
MQIAGLRTALGVLLILGANAFAEPSDSMPARSLTAAELVEHLGLDGHIEGGFFRRTYVSDYTLLTADDRERLSLSSIFYLLAAESPIGHFHLNQSDIVHYFHLGDPITYYLLHPTGKLETTVMGSDVRNGQVLQLTVPGGVWKASEIPANGSHGFGLISEAVTPGFEYDDMTLGYRDLLMARFPQHEALVKRLSHARAPNP